MQPLKQTTLSKMKQGYLYYCKDNAGVYIYLGINKDHVMMRDFYLVGALPTNNGVSVYASPEFIDDLNAWAVFIQQQVNYFMNVQPKLNHLLEIHKNERLTWFDFPIGIEFTVPQLQSWAVKAKMSGVNIPVTIKESDTGLIKVKDLVRHGVYVLVNGADYIYVYMGAIKTQWDAYARVFIVFDGVGTILNTLKNQHGVLSVDDSLGLSWGICKLPPLVPVDKAPNRQLKQGVSLYDIPKLVSQLKIDDTAFWQAYTTKYKATLREV